MPNLPTRSSRTNEKETLWSVIRFLWLDFAILLLILIMATLVYFLAPTFERLISKNDLVLHLSYPQKKNTVPSIALPFLALILPLLAILLNSYFSIERDIKFLLVLVLGLFYAVASTWLVTNTLKSSVGRPRPNFRYHCFPDGNLRFDKWGHVNCSVPSEDLVGSRQSFPSGHTSLSFVGMTYLALFVHHNWIQKLKLPEGSFVKLALAFSPLLVAFFVAVSRVSDYKHHWQDVVVGALIGIGFAVLFFNRFNCSDKSLGGASLSLDSLTPRLSNQLRLPLRESKNRGYMQWILKDSLNKDEILEREILSPSSLHIESPQCDYAKKSRYERILTE